MSFVVRIMRSALPFWEELYGQDMRNWTPREEEGTRGGVIKLTVIVTLDDLDGEAELSRYLGEKVEKCGERIRLRTQGKRPRIMRKSSTTTR
jgi:hypothetical protein